GSKGVIITAKHHDGFCLFDTKLTDHNVMNTPFGKDIVKMLSESCKKYGLKFGVYLSPWDRHEKTYGTDAYNDFFVAQLTELSLNYGDIFCFWFDGACGEGPNGKKQVYDWDRYYSVIRQYHPDAVISISGPDVRWIGNEGGRVRKSEWSVIPSDRDSAEAVAENSQTDASQMKLMAEKLDERNEDLGSREVLRSYNNLIFKPAEADVSVNLGWFHTSNIFAKARRGRSAKKLAEIYFNTVGGNASMLLNVPPDRHGLIGKSEEKRLMKFAELIRKPFENEITDTELFHLTAEGENRKPAQDDMLSDDEIGYTLKLDSKQSISALTLRENLAFSQRTEEFRIFVKNGKGEYTEVYKGTVIGSKKIVSFDKAVTTDEIAVVVTQSRSNPVLTEIKIYR
ncbi:MAG: alpha-L-fucosidase, partial [Clostridia bacterium]|nr:alpha-L-fucosidase [Clostridia bacterium]